MGRDRIWTVYVRGDRVIVPTTGKTEAGYYLDIEPVQVASLADNQAVAHALGETMRRGNPIVPTPLRKNFPIPAVLRPAGVRSWSAFMKKARAWSIEQCDGSYTLVPQNSEGHGWVADPKKVICLPHRGSLDEVAAAAATYILSTRNEGTKGTA